MLRRLALSICLLLFCVTAQAAPHFPALTGRVVDNAHVLSQQTVDALDQKLAEYEQGTTNQVVVVTLPSLDGTTIEDYGYQLGRFWGIGQKGKDNGVLLIVVPSSHHVRIEVGYGLEGTLTDAASSTIIHDILLPEFRVGNMQQGIIDGTDAILSVLGGKGMPVVQKNSVMVPLVINLLVIGFLLYLFIRSPGLLTAMLLNNSLYSGGSGGGGWSGGGGGFSGGGGSFGGGGSSGSW